MEYYQSARASHLLFAYMNKELEQDQVQTLGMYNIARYI